MTEIKLEKIENFICKNIDLTVASGETFVIIGPNGAGKTTLLNIIAGFIGCTGKIFSNLVEITSLNPEKRKIGYIFQESALFPHLTLRENILFGTKCRNIPEKSAENSAENLMNLFKINHLKQRYPKTLSGGEKQRAALARALAGSPDVLLMDEPFSQLDPQITVPLERDFKQAVKKMKITAIMVTHDIDTAFTLGNRIGVMDMGKLVQIGTPGEIFRKPANHFVANFMGTNNVYTGTAQTIDDKNIFKINGLDIYTLPHIGNSVSISIRPDDVLLSNQALKSSARNCFKGIVKQIRPTRNVMEITADIGILIKSFVTRQALEQLDINENKEIHVIFKASAVHVFE